MIVFLIMTMVVGALLGVLGAMTLDLRDIPKTPGGPDPEKKAREEKIAFCRKLRQEIDKLGPILDELTNSVGALARQLGFAIGQGVIATGMAAVAAGFAIALGWTPMGAALAAAAAAAAYVAAEAWAKVARIRARLDELHKTGDAIRAKRDRLRKTWEDEGCATVKTGDTDGGRTDDRGTTTPKNPGTPTGPRRPEDGRDP